MHDGNKLSRLVCSCWFLFLWRIFRRDSWLIEHRTRDRKVASSNPGRSGGESFLLHSWLSVLTLVGCPFHPVLRHWHVKDPGHSAQSAGGRLYLNTHTPLTIHPWPNEVEVGWLCRCPGIAWEAIRKRAHTQLVREHSATVISACWATVDWS